MYYIWWNIIYIITLSSKIHELFSVYVRKEQPQVTLFVATKFAATKVTFPVTHVTARGKLNFSSVHHADDSGIQWRTSIGKVLHCFKGIWWAQWCSSVSHRLDTWNVKYVSCEGTLSKNWLEGRPRYLRHLCGSIIHFSYFILITKFSVH